MPNDTASTPDTSCRTCDIPEWPSALSENGECADCVRVEGVFNELFQGLDCSTTATCPADILKDLDEIK